MNMLALFQCIVALLQYFLYNTYRKQLIYKQTGQETICSGNNGCIVLRDKETGVDFIYG
jgi:hypothetical protein